MRAHLKQREHSFKILLTLAFGSALALTGCPRNDDRTQPAKSPTEPSTTPNLRSENSQVREQQVSPEATLAEPSNRAEEPRVINESPPYSAEQQSITDEEYGLQADPGEEYSGYSDEEESVPLSEESWEQETLTEQYYGEEGDLSLDDEFPEDERFEAE